MHAPYPVNAGTGEARFHFKDASATTAAAAQWWRIHSPPALSADEADAADSPKAPAIDKDATPKNPETAKLIAKIIH